MEWLLLAIAVFIFLRYFVNIKGISYQPPIDQVNTTSAFDWSGDGEYEFDIVGESHYQSELKEICGNHGTRSPDKYCQARIFLENDNKHDSNAVRVDIENRTVGYFDRYDAISYRDKLKRKGLAPPYAYCDALIVGGYNKKDGSKASYGVKLDLEEL